MSLTRLALALTVALAAGCSRAEPEPEAQPATGAAAGPGVALEKLNDTKTKMGEIDAKRREQNSAAERGEAP